MGPRPLHPGRVRAVVNGSVPYTQWPAPPTDVFESIWGDRFFYILYFQPVGPAEAELEADVERTMRTVLWAASGEAYPRTGRTRRRWRAPASSTS